MKKYATLLSYDGTAYHGWQRQKGSAAEGGTSVQATIEETLRRVTSEPEARIVGSGRTDAGVHATGQVAHFLLSRREWDPEILRKGLSSLLPASIRALAVREVPLDFHAQRSASKKQYSYYFQQGSCALPWLMKYSRWIRKPLDLEAMRAALEGLKGRHDFKPFQSAGAKVGTTVREILEAELSVEPIAFPALGSFATPPGGSAPTLVRLRLVGTGFLKQMVRGIAGTLLQVGEGRRPPDCITEILRTQDRLAVGPTGPGRALWLERVWYPGIEF